MLYFYIIMQETLGKLENLVTVILMMVLFLMTKDVLTMTEIKEGITMSMRMMKMLMIMKMIMMVLRMMTMMICAIKENKNVSVAIIR